MDALVEHGDVEVQRTDDGHRPPNNRIFDPRTEATWLLVAADLATRPSTATAPSDSGGFEEDR